MTDYRRWDCFDPDTAIEELDKKEALLDAKIQRRRDEESELKSTERTLLEVKTAAEIANTKATVEALKAKGRRTRKPKTQEVIKDPQDQDRIFTLKILQAGEDLQKILYDVEDLKLFAETTSRHATGFSKALRCVEDVANFYAIEKELLKLKEGIDTQSSNDAYEGLNETKLFLRNKSLQNLALFSFTIKEYAMAAEICRYLLKLLSNKYLWALRGLAFAAMGVPFLANLHFKSCANCSQPMEGIQPVVERSERLIRSLARNHSKDDIQKLVKYELIRSFMVVLVDDTFLLKTSGDLSTLNENDVFQLPGMWIYECSGLTQNSNHSAQQLFMDDNSIAEKVIASDQTESRVPIEDAFNNISKNSNEEIFSFLDRVFDVGTQPSILINICKVLFEHKSQNENDSWLKKTKYTQFYETTNLEVGAKKVMGISTDEVLILYDFCRKLFYEGQVLFVEGFYLQAESKYYAIIILALALVQSSSSQEYTGFINEWISYCLMNIAFCRVNRCIGNKKVVSPVDELIIDSYVGEGLHSLDFMEASLRFHCGHLTRYKKLQLLESLDRFEEALFEAQSLVSLPIGDLAGANDLFRFTEECVLSQMYMPGYPLPQAANLIATDTEALTIWRRTLAKKIAKLSSKLKNS